jgi:hypothetical protein
MAQQTRVGYSEKAKRERERESLEESEGAKFHGRNSSS